VEEEGGAEAPPAASRECRHLNLGRLAANGLASMFDQSFEGLPALADDVLVGGDGAFGRHAQRVSLNADLGSEFAFALRGAVEADGTVEIFVAAVIGEFSSCVSRFGNGAE
jgi:hypothetical protein